MPVTNNTTSTNAKLISGNYTTTINSGGYAGVYSKQYLTPSNPLLIDSPLQPSTEYYLTTNATGLQWTNISPVKEDEIIIDITKATVEIYDFTKKKVSYNLKQLKTKYISNEEINCVVVERDVLPGELKKLTDFQNSQEVLLEFEGYSDDERYGKKYVSKSVNWIDIDEFNRIINIPTVLSYPTTTIADDLVSVQPMGTPSGNLFYIDPIFI